MKPSTRILCLAGLLLSLLSSCQQTAGSKSELSLKAAAFNQEDAAIAKQFGYSSDPLIFQFTTDSSVQSLHYTVYTLNQGQWEAQWTGDQSLSGLRGRIAVYTDGLPKGYTLIMQCDNVCVKDELRVENPDFSMPEQAVLSTAVLSEETSWTKGREFPILVQQISTHENKGAVNLEQFFKPDHFSDQDEVWALTLIFQESENSRQLPSK